MCSGELLVTAGVLVLLFLGWQLWFNDLVVGAQQQTAADQLAEEWERSTGRSTRRRSTGADRSSDLRRGATVEEGTGRGARAPARGAAFATLMIPRFGADYARTIGEGVGNAVLEQHQPRASATTRARQMPGEVGNFAVAAHRNGVWRQRSTTINELRVGDPIFVETADGWYTYRFRSTEYVPPTGVDVLAPVPQDRRRERRATASSR